MFQLWERVTFFFKCSIPMQNDSDDEKEPIHKEKYEKNNKEKSWKQEKI